MQVDPIKPKSKPPKKKHLKLNYDEPLSNVAFKFNLRRYTQAREQGAKLLRAICTNDKRAQDLAAEMGVVTMVVTLLAEKDATPGKVKAVGSGRYCPPR